MSKPDLIAEVTEYLRSEFEPPATEFRVVSREQLQKNYDNLVRAINDIRDTVDGYIDVIDGDYGRPSPNVCMQVDMICKEALEACGVK